MNTAAAPETIDATTRGGAAPWRSYLLFTLCASLYLLPFMRILQLGGDEGTIVYGAVRIVHGQVFARDFFEVMGPGSFYWLAAFYKLFGVTFLAARISLFLASLGTGLLMYFLSRRILERYRILPCLILASTYFGPVWPGSSHHVDSNFLALLSVACVVLWKDRKKNILLLAAGVLAGISTFFLQPKGLLLLLAILLWLWVQHRRRVAPIAALCLVAVGFLGAATLALAYFWSQGALSSLVYANVVWPFHHYERVNAVPYAQGIIPWYLEPWLAGNGGLNWRVGIVAILVQPFIFVAALPMFLLILGFRRRWKIATPEILLYSLCGCALWISELHRKDICHLVFGSPLLIVLCVYLLSKSRSRVTGYASQMLGITSAILATFNLFLVVTAHSVTTRVGSVAIFKDDPTLAFLNTHATECEDIFVYPYRPMYYFLSSTSNPTRYSLLMYSYNTDSQFYDAIRSLEERKPRYVVWDVSFETKARDYFPTSDRRGTADLIIEPYLESHYHLVTENDGYRIMERKEDQPAN